MYPDSVGCYLYYFKYQEKTFCIDATEESVYLGRLLNHSRKGNCHTKVVVVDGRPHVVILASKDIEARVELLYDYGDRRPQSLQAHPWLAF